MPLLSILAPGTRVEVDGMVLPKARIESAVVRAGADPVRYWIAWKDSAGPHRGEWKALAVREVPEDEVEQQPATAAEIAALIAQLQERKAQLERGGA
jgi:hypothetical protein